MDEHFRELPCKRAQSARFGPSSTRKRNVPPEKQGEFGVGGVGIWTAICADTKLRVSWLLGSRNTQVVTDVYARHGRPAGEPDGGHDGQAPALPGSGRGRLRFRDRLRRAPEALRERATGRTVRYRPTKCIGTHAAAIACASRSTVMFAFMATSR